MIQKILPIHKCILYVVFLCFYKVIRCMTDNLVIVFLTILEIDTHQSTPYHTLKLTCTELTTKLKSEKNSLVLTI